MKTTLFNALSAESISALADGELRGEEFDRVMATCQSDPALLENWHNYHLIGDVLRSPDLLAARPPALFLTRLQKRLAHETLPAVAQDVDSLPMIGVLPVAAQAAANDALFRWKLVAGMASMAVVAGMVWSLAVQAPSSGSQLAQSPASTDPVWVASPQGTNLRDARLEELLAAHKQVGGNSALQMPSGFLRNATFETSSHARR
jgi:sigma-E factor negative regulatory protein RseA